MASSREAINVYNLNYDERQRLRATIDALDNQSGPKTKPTFQPLRQPLGPVCEDASVVGEAAAKPGPSSGPGHDCGRDRCGHEPL
jgi:hypothetical protein